MTSKDYIARIEKAMKRAMKAPMPIPRPCSWNDPDAPLGWCEMCKKGDGSYCERRTK